MLHRPIALLTIVALTFQACAFSGRLNRSDRALPPKNIILLIGDGMGPNQLTLPLLLPRFSRAQEFADPSLGLLLSKAHLGQMIPLPHQALVIDSACAITEMSAGEEALPETLGLNANGERIETVLELARARGKSAGLVSDTRITHATPAGFVAKVPHRNMEDEIAEQLVASGVEVLLSGGLRHFVPKDFQQHSGSRCWDSAHCFPANFKLLSKRSDQKNLLQTAKQHGYSLVFERSTLLNSQAEKLLGLFADSGMVDGIAEYRALNDSTRTYPSLAEMTAKALQILEQDTDGFFLMVEAGQIDWAGHANDAGMLLHEMLRLDRTLSVILKWLEGKQDTILVVTADHETGGFAFSYSAANIPKPVPFPGQQFPKVQYAPQFNFGNPGVLQKLSEQRQALYPLMMSFQKLPPRERTASKLMALVNANSPFPINSQQAERILQTETNKYFNAKHAKLSVQKWARIEDFSAFYPDPDARLPALVARAISEQQGIVWSSGSHTSLPVFVAAFGQTGREQSFSGLYESTDLGKKLKALLN